MFKLVFFVPEEHKEKVKDALFSLEAGKLGDYGNCCWECEGTGQFMPLENSNPFLGSKDKVERVREYRVEMLVHEELIPLCIEILMEYHPYETPAYEFYKVYLKETEIEGEHWL